MLCNDSYKSVKVSFHISWSPTVSHVCQLKTDYMYPSSPVKYQVEVTRQAAVESSHDRIFIMTDVVCQAFIYCSEQWANAQSVPRDCHQDAFLKKCFWHLTNWQDVSVFSLPALR